MDDIARGNSFLDYNAARDLFLAEIGRAKTRRTEVWAILQPVVER
jgi:hypothetical protein